jgi:hypothetical protein
MLRRLTHDVGKTKFLSTDAQCLTHVSKTVLSEEQDHHEYALQRDHRSDASRWFAVLAASCLATLDQADADA